MTISLAGRGSIRKKDMFVCRASAPFNIYKPLSSMCKFPLNPIKTTDLSWNNTQLVLRFSHQTCTVRAKFEVKLQSSSNRVSTFDP